MHDFDITDCLILILTAETHGLWIFASGYLEGEITVETTDSSQRRIADLYACTYTSEIMSTSL